MKDETVETIVTHVQRLAYADGVGAFASAIYMDLIPKVEAGAVPDAILDRISELQQAVERGNPFDAPLVTGKP